MKKTLIAAIAAIALSLPAWGQVINVNTPGTDWCIGSPYTITWTKSGTMPDTVKIRLRRAGSPESETSPWSISDGTPNDGSFGPVTVPGSVPAGDYFIRVRTNDPDVIGDSGTFHISTCAPTSISVTLPVASTDWCIGDPCTITWTKSGTMPDTVKIRLRRAGSPESETSPWSISDGTPNDGSFGPVNVPASVPPGNYFVRVRTNDPDVIGNSANFEVKDCSGPSITVTKPNTTHGCCIGRDCTIQWTNSEGVGPASVKITLSKSPFVTQSTITNSTANDGEYIWPVPESKTAGDYRITVETTGALPHISDTSDTFKIYQCVDPWILDKLRKMRYYIRIPRWPPEPDPWWRIDFGEFREIMHNKFEGSVFLLKNGQKVKEIGNFGKTTPLPDSLKFQMGELNSKSLKNRSAKFSIGIFDAQGKMMQETPLEVQVEQQLKQQLR